MLVYNLFQNFFNEQRMEDIISAIYSQIFLIVVLKYAFVRIMNNTNDMTAAKILILYLLIDFNRMLYNFKKNMTMICHHLIVVLIISYLLYFEMKIYYEYIIISCLFEISTIFLNNKILFHNYKTSYVILINNMLFVITFFIFRIYLGSYILYLRISNIILLHHEDFIGMPEILYGLLLCLQYYWFVFILKKIYKMIYEKID
jgi:hypothetical protein